MPSSICLWEYHRVRVIIPLEHLEQYPKHTWANTLRGLEGIPHGYWGQYPWGIIRKHSCEYPKRYCQSTWFYNSVGGERMHQWPILLTTDSWSDWEGLYASLVNFNQHFLVTWYHTQVAFPSVATTAPCQCSNQ